MFDTSRRRLLQALGLGGAASVAGCAGAPQTESDPPSTGSAPAQADTGTPAPKQTDVDSVAADPADLPDPVDRDSPASRSTT